MARFLKYPAPFPSRYLRQDQVVQNVITPAKTFTGQLAHSAFHALKWRSAGMIVQVSLQFVVGIVLARLLAPDAFGILGMALIVTGFMRLVGDMGFGVAMIQRPSLKQEHLRAAFTGTVIMGLLLFFALWFLAPTISHLFVQDGLTFVLRMLGVSFVFFGVCASPIALLRRELRFRTLACIESISYFFGFGVIGISLALSGYGMWSLVAANVIQPFCLASLAIFVTKYPLWPYFRAREYLDLLSVASAEMLNNVTNYVAGSLDYFVVGKWLGAFALGIYNRSYYLMLLPVNHFSAMLFSVMFPLLSQVQTDVTRLGRVLTRTVAITSTIAIPVFFAMAAVPEVVIGGLFGVQWKSAASVLRILCLCGPFMALIHIFGAMSHACGCVFKEWNRQAIYLLIMAISVFILLPYGVEGIALAVAIASFARYLLLAHLALKLAKIGWKQFLIVQIPGYVLGITTFVSAYLASRIIDTYQMADFVQLLIIIPFCLTTFLTALLILPTALFGDLYPWLIERFGMNIPFRMRKVLITKISQI